MAAATPGECLGAASQNQKVSEPVRKSHPAAASCAPHHLQPEGFLCRQTAQHLPRQLQAPGLGNAPVLGAPWGPGVCLSVGATPRVLKPGSVWEETPGVLGSALVEAIPPCPPSGEPAGTPSWFLSESELPACCRAETSLPSKGEAGQAPTTPKLRRQKPPRGEKLGPPHGTHHLPVHLPGPCQPWHISPVLGNVPEGAPCAARAHVPCSPQHPVPSPFPRRAMQPRQGWGNPR